MQHLEAIPNIFAPFEGDFPVSKLRLHLCKYIRKVFVTYGNCCVGYHWQLQNLCVLTFYFLLFFLNPQHSNIIFDFFYNIHNKIL